jgi:hypothetical protein
MTAPPDAERAPRPGRPPHRSTDHRKYGAWVRERQPRASGGRLIRVAEILKQIPEVIEARRRARPKAA